MESISNKKLPPIFKLSLLSKILPYFGHLHDWKMILESINKKTNDIWDQNKEQLKYCGRDLKLSLHLNSRFIKLSENILLKAELFKFQTDRFFEFHRSTGKTQDKIKKLRIDSLILQLCSQLNEDNAIVFQKCDYGYYDVDEIFLQTRTEIAEMIPSSKCTSSILEIKEFDANQAQDLCKYIAVSIWSKRVIIKKNENNTFEVDSITSHHFLDRDKYSILNKNVRGRLVTYYSCPVSNCICKPKNLLLGNKYIELSEDLIDKICGISLLENAYRLKVNESIKTFSEISHLSRIKQQFSKLEILFDLNSCRDYIELVGDYEIDINSKLITCVANGEEWIFHINGNDQCYVYWISDIEFNEKENIAIINCGKIFFQNVVLQTNSQSEIKDKTLIDKLKEKTRLEDSQYIIVDTSTLELHLYAFKIKKYTTIAKYFKFIKIEINEIESKYKEEIEEINKLPKQCSICIWIDNIHEFINSDALNLIDQDFDQIIVESNRFKIKLIKSNNRSGERMFTVFESLFYKTKTADIRELRKIISKKY